MFGGVVLFFLIIILIIILGWRSAGVLLIIIHSPSFKQEKSIFIIFCIILGLKINKTVVFARISI